MYRRSLFSLAAAVLFVGFGALEARAGFVPLPTTLDQLIPSGNFTTNGALLFTNFAYSTTDALAPAPTDISVVKFNAIATEPGLEFQGGFGLTSFGAPKQYDFRISFDVTSTNGTAISDAYLHFDGTAINDGFGSITETITAGTKQYVMYVDTTNPPTSQADSVTFAGVTTIHVVKDIYLYVDGGAGAGKPGSVSFSIMDQGFSTAVPEPASMGMFSIGMLGLIVFRRRFKKPLAV